eukprot:COSAG02_NODE_4227_length_5610_cov_4.036654_5_plen_76_part_00
MAGELTEILHWLTILPLRVRLRTFALGSIECFSPGHRLWMFQGTNKPRDPLLKKAAEAQRMAMQMAQTGQANSPI